MANNYGNGSVPRLVASIDGRVGARNTLKFVAKDSSALYIGSFVTAEQGTSAAPTGVIGGVTQFTDDDIILGYVVGITKYDGITPIIDDTTRAGTLTDASGEIPAKYTFSATNDRTNGSSAKLELVEVMPIRKGDILEVTLWGTSTASTTRGTTTGSDTEGYALSVDTTYTFALTESTASNDYANLDFATTSLNGRLPANTNRMYVTPLRVGRTAPDA